MDDVEYTEIYPMLDRGHGGPAPIILSLINLILLIILILYSIRLS